jgi:enoyl-CoA hydratase/carnithine racemase
MSSAVLKRTDLDDNRIVIIELCRDEVLNAVNTAMAKELLSTFEAFQWDRTVRAVIFTSRSERAFCVGADLRERRTMSDDDWHTQHQIMREAIFRILRCPVPVIAAVEGHALGGGCELASACDFIVAGDRAIFALPEVTRGILPGAGATQYLSRVVGTPVAKELIFTGRSFGAEEARSLGLVNHVVAAGKAKSRALEIAKTIAENAPFAVRQAKKAINWGAETDLWTGLTLSFEAWDNTVHTEDRLEGVRAFNEKRKPRFQGR